MIVFCPNCRYKEECNGLFDKCKNCGVFLTNPFSIFKEKKKVEEQTGEATFTETEHLLFKAPKE